MPRSAKLPADDTVIRPGDHVEIRVAQVWFWEGYYARRAISLQRHYKPVPLQVTDLDLIAVEVDPQLRPRKVIGESKSGGGKSAPKPLDRIMWLRGLMDLLGDPAGAELTVADNVALQVRELGRTLSVSVQSVDDLQRREQRARMDTVRDVGSHGPSAFVAERRTHRIVAREPELERIYWLVRSDVWYVSPWMAIKRLMAAIEFASQRFAPRVDDDTQHAIRWLLAELVGQFTLQLVVASGPALSLDPGEFVSYASDQLADPGVDRRRMRQISDAMDRYVAGVLRRVGAPESAIVDSIGAFVPRAPQYTEPLVETARRVTQRVDIARALPRYVDVVIHERLVRRREPTAEVIGRFANADAMARAARVVAAFLAGQAGLPQQIAALVGDSTIDPVDAERAAPAVLAAAENGDHHTTSRQTYEPSLFGDPVRANGSPAREGQTHTSEADRPEEPSARS